MKFSRIIKTTKLFAYFLLLRNEPLIISLRPSSLKSRLTNMSWTIVLFIESYAFDIQLTTDGEGASTNEIKPHLVSLNSVWRASTRSLRLFTRTEQIRIFIILQNVLPKIVIAEKSLRDFSIYYIRYYRKKQSLN